MPQRIGVLHTHLRQAPPQGAHAVLVDVDGDEVATEPGERHCQCAVARAHLEDGAARLGDEVDDPPDRRAVDEEVLAELVSAAVD
ncbi:hypothetical protein GCM10025774_11020 [Microbacterium kyungheense]